MIITAAAAAAGCQGDSLLELCKLPRAIGPTQPKESKLCGQYAAAWALNISPFITVQHLGNGATFEQEMLLALNRIAWQSDWYDWVSLHPAAPAVMLGKDMQNGLHWIGYRNGQFYDPLQGHPRKTAGSLQSQEPQP